MQDAQDFDTAAHEIGHVLDEKFDLVSKADIDGMIQRYTKDSVAAAWLSQYKEAQRPAEMMAEYIKAWMRDRAEALNFGGQTLTKYFEDSLKQAGFLPAMQEAARDWKRYLSATASERAMASIDLTETKARKTPAEKLTGLATAVFDSTLPLLKLENARKKQMGESYETKGAAHDVRTLMLGSLQEIQIIQRAGRGYRGAVLFERKKRLAVYLRRAEELPQRPLLISSFV